MSARHRTSPTSDDPVSHPTATPDGRLYSLLRRHTIKGRLARVVGVSLAIILALLGITVANVLRGYQAAGDTAKAMTLALTVQDVIHELQRERGLTSGLLGGETRYRADVTAQRPNTDAALATLDRAINNDRGQDAMTVRAALDMVHALPATRGNVDTGRALRDPTFQYYTDAITGLNRLDLGFDQAQDTTLRHDLQALQTLGDAKEFTGQERGFLNGVFATGHFEGDQYVHFLQVRADKLSSLSRFTRYATPDQRARLDTVLRSPAAVAASGNEGTAMGGADGKLLARVDPPSWWASMTQLVNDMRTVQRSIGDDIRARTAQLQGAATQEFIVVLLLGLLAVAAEILLAVGAARSITGPLAALVRDADDIATQRLPAAVARAQTVTDDEPSSSPPDPLHAPARAGLEIVAVAGALDRVRRTAVELATEQAVLRRNTTESLANLGRRNQNLVRRQLGFISQLEQEELDPSALANLFELDHLATRMRRNAESLLALVGQSSPRLWSEPVPVADVIRAALSEVEEYRRVVIRRVDDVQITGAVVAELAHMLAELIENGLSFSPPDIEVEIYGRRMGTRYLLAVIDHGVGMRPNMITQANTRLRGKEDFLVAPARFLGHFVVGRLAERLSIDVQLTDSPVVGVTARMMLPADIVVGSPTAPAALDAARSPTAPAALETAGSPPAAAADSKSQERPPPAKAPAIAGPHTPAPESSQWNGTVGPEATAATPIEARHEPPAAVRDQQTSVPSATVATPAPAAQPLPAAPGPERTRNGLVKRTPRKATTAAPDTPAPRREPVDERSVQERSPGDVRAMLAAFRAAHRRGERSSFPDTTNPVTATRTTGHPRPPHEEGHT